MKVLAITILMVFFSTASYSGQTLDVGETRLIVERAHALNAMEDSMNDIPGLLKQYKPQGAQIRNLLTRGSQLSFKIVKGIFSVGVRAEVELVRSRSLCSAEAVAGYQMIFDLRESDSLVSTHLESLKVLFCVMEPKADQLNIVVKGAVVKAPTFSSSIGNMLVSGMAEQVPAVGEAVRKHILAQP